MTLEEEIATQDEAPAEPVETPEAEQPEGKEPAAKAKEPAEQEEKPDPEPEKPKARPWFMERIDRQGQQNAELRRQIEELQRRVAPEQKQEGGGDDVEQRVAAELAKREGAERLNRFDSAGRSEFSDFVERCNTVANCGALDRPEFMQIVSQMDDGHKLVAHLADHPDDTVRLLAMTPARMALEIGKMSAKGFVPPPAPRTAVPPPIKPIQGAGSKETDDNLSDEAWWRKHQSRK